MNICEVLDGRASDEKPTRSHQPRGREEEEEGEEEEKRFAHARCRTERGEVFEHFTTSRPLLRICVWVRKERKW